MKSWAWAAVGLLVGAGIVGGAACGGSDTGSGGSAGTGGSGGSASTVNPTKSTSSSTGSGQGGMGDCGSLPSQFTLPTPACGMCVGDQCCSEAKACDTGTDCYNLLACESQGQMTPAQCEATYANGVDPLTKLNSCISAKCGTADTCGVMCMGNNIAYNSTALADCNSCINGMCCDEFSALSTDLNNSTDPNCMQGGDMSMCPPLADLQTCEMTPNAAVCSSDPDAGAAANCENTKCGDTCPQFICDSGIEQTGMGAGTCAQCLTTSCCAEFSASMCSDSSQQAACQTWLDDFNSCAMDPTGAMCTGDASANAAFTCQTTNCNTECGGM